MKAIQKVAERQHGLITREQALAHGMNSNQVGARLRRGTWERVARNVYRIPGSVPTWEQRMLAAVWAAGEGAAACRQSAATLWRIPGFAPGPVEVVQPRGPSARYAASGMHASRFLPTHQVRFVRAIPTTSPERTILDLCGCIHPGRAERALDNGLAMELTRVQQLGLMLAESGARGRPGVITSRPTVGVITQAGSTCKQIIVATCYSPPPAGGSSGSTGTS